MNKHHQIMAEDFAKGFIPHRNVRLAAKRIAELPLDHTERRFDVGAKVVVLQKLFPFEAEIMKHFAPRLSLGASFLPRIAGAAIDLERDERSRSGVGDVPRILVRKIALVGRNFTNVKGLLRGIE